MTRARTSLQTAMRERCESQGCEWQTVGAIGLRVEMVCRWCGARRPQAPLPPKRPGLTDVVTTKGRRA
jgi:hypothetical protein